MSNVLPKCVGTVFGLRRGSYATRGCPGRQAFLPQLAHSSGFPHYLAAFRTIRRFSALYRGFPQLAAAFRNSLSNLRSRGFPHNDVEYMCIPQHPARRGNVGVASGAGVIRPPGPEAWGVHPARSGRAGVVRGAGLVSGSPVLRRGVCILLPSGRGCGWCPVPRSILV